MRRTEVETKRRGECSCLPQPLPRLIPQSCRASVGRMLAVRSVSAARQKIPVGFRASTYANIARTRGRWGFLLDLLRTGSRDRIWLHHALCTALRTRSSSEPSATALGKPSSVAGNHPGSGDCFFRTTLAARSPDGAWLLSAFGGNAERPRLPMRRVADAITSCDYRPMSRGVASSAGLGRVLHAGAEWAVSYWAVYGAPRSAGGENYGSRTRDLSAAVAVSTFPVWVNVRVLLTRVDRDLGGFFEFSRAEGGGAFGAQPGRAGRRPPSASIGDMRGGLRSARRDQPARLGGGNRTARAARSRAAADEGKHGRWISAGERCAAGATRMLRRARGCGRWRCVAR